MARAIVRGKHRLPLQGMQQQQQQQPPTTSASTPAAGAAVGAGQGSRGGTGGQAGLLQLTGTEEQLFAQALEYVPPHAAAELVEVAQVSAHMAH
jgi:hypothetical protein